jgi:hypothetical protein
MPEEKETKVQRFQYEYDDKEPWKVLEFKSGKWDIVMEFKNHTLAKEFQDKYIKENQICGQ